MLWVLLQVLGWVNPLGQRRKSRLGVRVSIVFVAVKTTPAGQGLLPSLSFLSNNLGVGTAVGASPKLVLLKSIVICHGELL